MGVACGLVGCSTELRDIEQPTVTADFTPSSVRETADSLMSSGVARAVVQQTTDRTRLSISLRDVTDAEVAALDFRFSGWSERTDGDEHWLNHDGYSLAITDGADILDVEVTSGGDSTFYFNGARVTDSATAQPGAHELQRYFGLVNDDTNLGLLVQGNPLEAETSSVRRQAISGTQWHEYTKHDGTNGHLHHLYDWPYWNNPQGAQTNGGWDCFWLPVGSCPGTETKVIYHSPYNGCNDTFYYSNSSTPHGSYHCTSGVWSHTVF